MAGTCGYGEELSGSINAGNFLISGKVYWLASLLHGVSIILAVFTPIFSTLFTQLDCIILSFPFQYLSSS